MSQAEFARRSGRSRSTISEACSKGGPLRAATKNGSIDVAHPAVRAWAKRGKIPINRLRDRGNPEPDPIDPREADDDVDLENARFDVTQPANVNDFLDLPFRQIADRFGSVEGFEKYLDARKTTEEIRKLEVANDEAEGKLISRSLVQQHIFGALEAQNRRLLMDTTRTIAARVAPAVRTGANQEQLEELVRDLISSQLRIAKDTATRILRERSVRRRGEETEEPE